jgi:hypothetical protein
MRRDVVAQLLDKGSHDFVGNANSPGNVLLNTLACDKEIFVTYHLNAMVPKPLIQLIDPCRIAHA